MSVHPAQKPTSVRTRPSVAEVKIRALLRSEQSAMFFLRRHKNSNKRRSQNTLPCLSCHYRGTSILFSAVRVQTQQRPICPPLYLLPLPAPLCLYCAGCGLAIKSQFNECNSTGGGGRKWLTSPTSAPVVWDIFQKYRYSYRCNYCSF